MGGTMFKSIATVLSYMTVRISPQAFDGVCNVLCVHIQSPQMDSFYLCYIFYLKNSKPLINSSC